MESNKNSFKHNGFNFLMTNGIINNNVQSNVNSHSFKDAALDKAHKFIGGFAQILKDNAKILLNASQKVIRDLAKSSLLSQTGLPKVTVNPEVGLATKEQARQDANKKHKR